MESRADFIHKMSMALKEAREARYWLALTERAKILPAEAIGGLLQEAGELVAILSQSVITAKAKTSDTSNLKPNTLNPKVF